MPKNEPPNSVIGEGSTFEGTFHVPGSLKVDGRFEGEIKTEGHLIIGTTGKVKTTILSARRVTVAGTLIGNIEAQEEVSLLETGRVLGNIQTPKLHLSEGVVTEGQITITGGQQKDIHRVVEESFGGKKAAPEKKEEAKNTEQENKVNAETKRKFM